MMRPEQRQKLLEINSQGAVTHSTAARCRIHQETGARTKRWMLAGSSVDSGRCTRLERRKISCSLVVLLHGVSINDTD